MAGFPSAFSAPPHANIISRGGAENAERLRNVRLYWANTTLRKPTP